MKKILTIISAIGISGIMLSSAYAFQNQGQNRNNNQSYNSGCRYENSKRPCDNNRMGMHKNMRHHNRHHDRFDNRNNNYNNQNQYNSQSETDKTAKEYRSQPNK